MVERAAYSFLTNAGNGCKPRQGIPGGNKSPDAAESTDEDWNLVAATRLPGSSPLVGQNPYAYTALTVVAGGRVIQKDIVYQKSTKGTQAIATRERGLSPKLRSLLILIDGKRGFDELVRLSQSFGDTGHLMAHLLVEGFIEAGAVAGRAAQAAPATTAVSLQDARRHAVRRLTDMLGPNAEELCLRIEAARDAHDFRLAIKGAEGMVRQFRGAEAARDFGKAIQNRMPAA